MKGRRSGGHGFMTTTYGTGASNILSASVVTLTGELVTANACQNTDIYWALRGGGSGTVGVVLSLTMAAYPEPFVNLGTVNIAARNGSSTSTNSTAWYATVARAHALLPALHDAGFQGYYVLAAPAEKGAQPPSFGLSLFNLEKDNATVQAAWRGFATALEKGFDNEQTTATASLTARVGTWSELYAALPAPGDSAGKGGGARTSRLISRKVVLEDEEALARTLERVGPGLVPQKVSGGMLLCLSSSSSFLLPAYISMRLFASPLFPSC
ncbi:hypothetical protein SLS55_009205 [Diplodia seriata]|uniref:Uncharacterized protein n=1 Tax=Diplodia seriata TaxID=420778 RepID=A0ABR3C857_9PEZI